MTAGNKMYVGTRHLPKVAGLCACILAVRKCQHQVWRYQDKTAMCLGRTCVISQDTVMFGYHGKYFTLSDKFQPAHI